MIKSLMFMGGAAAGFALASSLTEEQRIAVRDKATRITRGEHSQRLATAVVSTKDSVADVAVGAVETAADKVSTIAGKVDGDAKKVDPINLDATKHVPIKENGAKSNGSPSPAGARPSGVS